MNLAMQHRVWEDTEKEGSPNLCALQNSVLTFPMPSLGSSPRFASNCWSFPLP